MRPRRCRPTQDPPAAWRHTIRVRRPCRMTLGLIGCTIAVLGLVLVAVAGPAYRFGLTTLPNAFVILQWAEYAGLAAAAVSLIAAALAYRRGARVRMLVAALG